MFSDLMSGATYVVIDVKTIGILVYLVVFWECPNTLNFELHNLKKMAIEKDLLRL